MPKAKKLCLVPSENAALARETRWQDDGGSQTESGAEGDSDFSPNEVDFIEVFRDWASSLDKWNGKMLSTYLCFLIQRLCPQKRATTISATVAELFGISERAVRFW